MSLDRPKEALAHADGAVAGEPDEPGHLRLQAILLAQLDQERLARTVAQRAVEMAPQEWASHYVQALTLLGSRFTHEQAVAAARRAVELAPQETSAHVLLARAYLQHGARPSRQDRDAAMEHVLTALRIEPDNAQAIALLSETKRRSGDLAGSMASGLDAARTDPHAETGRYAIHNAFGAWVWRAHLGVFLAWWFFIRPRVGLAQLDPPRVPLVGLALVVAGGLWWVMRQIRTSSDGRIGLVLRTAWRVEPFAALWPAMLLLVPPLMLVAAFVPTSSWTVWRWVIGLPILLGAVMSWLARFDVGAKLRTALSPRS